MGHTKKQLCFKRYFKNWNLNSIEDTIKGLFGVQNQIHNPNPN